MPTTFNKPAGLPVFPPHADPAGDCVLKRLIADQPQRTKTAWPIGFEGGIAHRLDNSTSGALLVADTLEELEQIRTAFREHRFTKTYLLLAAKDVSWDRNTCQACIAHDPRRKDRMVVQRGQNTPHRGKWYTAHTEFRRRRRAASVPGILFEARITTGVMHQIRVHAAFVGIPLLGDRRYGGGPTPDSAPAGVEFYLHHESLQGPGSLRTDPVPDPPWLQASH